MKSRRTQLRLWLLALDLYEIRLRVKVSRERNAFIRASQEAYAANGVVPAWVAERHKSALRDILQAHYKAVIPHFGALALSNVKSRRIHSRKAADSLFSSFMLEWVTTEALRKATMIASTDYDDVRGAIADGLTEGLGTAEIGRAIRKQTSMTVFRAATVARTETHNAATFGSIETARNAEQELGLQLKKVWLPTLDDRTRPEHRAMETKDPIEMNEKFSVGADQMDRPGDPAASAENVINCRCAIAYEEKF
jgi:hypothetical protein